MSVHYTTRQPCTSKNLILLYCLYFGVEGNRHHYNNDVVLPSHGKWTQETLLKRPSVSVARFRSRGCYKWRQMEWSWSWSHRSYWGRPRTKSSIYYLYSIICCYHHSTKLILIFTDLYITPFDTSACLWNQLPVSFRYFITASIW